MKRLFDILQCTNCEATINLLRSETNKLEYPRLETIDDMVRCCDDPNVIWEFGRRGEMGHFLEVL